MAAKSFLVIGGGIIGTASALRLSAAGFDVALIDPGDMRRGASYGNAGHMGPEQVEPWSSFASLLRSPAYLFALNGGPLDFRLSDIAQWLPWSLRFIAAARPSQFARGTDALRNILREPIAAWQRLFALAERPSMVKPVGHCAVWMSERGAEYGLDLWAKTTLGNATYRDMTPGELEHLGSALRAVPVAGIKFTGSGQLTDPQGVRDTLREAFVAKGGTIVADSVDSVWTDAAGVGVRLASGKQLDAENALIAAGAWSGRLMQHFGIDAPVIGERGYHIHSPTHSWPEDLPPVVFEERNIIVTRFTSGLRTTSFLEFGDPDAPSDPRKWQTLEWHLSELGIAFSKTPDRWRGPRPTLPDYVPAIGRLEHDPRILYAFGHAHLGMTMAAITAEVIESIATEKSPPFDLTPFAIERFA